MSNGQIGVSVMVQRPTGPQREDHTYELGCASWLFGWRSLELEHTRQEISGSIDAPHLTLEGVTKREGHRFRFAAEFDYDLTPPSGESAPWGFRFTAGRLELLDGTEQPCEDFRFVHDLVEAIRNGEAEFRRSQAFVRRAQAAINQAVRERRITP